MKDRKRSSQFADYGWVHKSKMLLWRRCLVTESGKIARKAMIINTREHIIGGMGGKPDLVQFTDKPEDGGKVLYESKLFEFFYVIKYDPLYEELATDEQVLIRSKVLLGKKEENMELANKSKVRMLKTKKF